MQLKKSGRVGCAQYGGITYWLAVENKKAFAQAYADAVFDTILPDFDNAFSVREQIIIAMLKGWLMHLGPVTPSELGLILGS